MEWFRNPESNRDFEKYVQQLPKDDSDILRGYFIPISTQLRERISPHSDRRVLLEEILGNNDTIRDLPERRRKKVGNVIRKAIEFSYRFLFDPGHPARIAEPTEIPSPHENADIIDNQNAANNNKEDNSAVNPITAKKLSEYRREGNLLFNASKFKDAISCYSKAIEIDPTNPIYFSNRAMCYLKLSAFEFALFDAEKAISLDPLTTPKYQYRFALALAGLGDHEKSCEVLEKICLSSTDLQSILERERRMLRNVLGEFDFAEMEMKARKGEEILIADFIGPVAMSPGSGGDYSLYAGRDLKRGEVILVSKAVAFSSSCTEVSSLNESPITNETLTKLVEILASKAKHSILTAYRIYHLFYRDPKRTTVPAELYCPKGFQAIRGRAYPVYSLNNLEQVVKNNLYSAPPNSMSRGSSHAEIGSKNKGGNGVWYIPSFINHSCLATAHQSFIGDISVIQVNTDICAGSEITVGYIPLYDIMSVEERRRVLLSRWGFECHCDLCDFELDSRNSELLERTNQIHTQLLRLSSLNDNPLQIIGPHQYDLLTKLLSIAIELNLGAKMFNAAFWHAVIALTKLRVAPNESAIYFDFISQVEAFICELELTHQLLLWSNVLSYVDYIQLPEKDQRRVGVELKYKFVKSRFH